MIRSSACIVPPMFSFLSRRPYASILLAILLAADAGGVVHAFRRHGWRDGTIALVFPPYGVYRGTEALMHRADLTENEAVALSGSDSGRRGLSADLQLTKTAWTSLLALIESQPQHEMRSSMQESSTVYDIVATAEPGGPATLTIRNTADKNLTIALLDPKRTQTPETVVITKKVKGADEIHTTPLAKFSSDDASQFLLAWSLAWGTLAQEHQSELNLTSP